MAKTWGGTYERQLLVVDAVMMHQPRACSCPCNFPALGLYICPLRHISRLSKSPPGYYIQSRNGLTDTSTCPIYVCTAVSRCPDASRYLGDRVDLAQAGRRTYMSPFSKRFFRFSLMASLDTLLISVRSETPTSFFLVVSKTAFLANCDVGCPLPAAASFLRPARLETACTSNVSACVCGA